MFWQNISASIQLKFDLTVLSNWMASVNLSSQYGVCRAEVVSYVLREIWVSRCDGTFEGSKMCAREIHLRVIRRVELLSLIDVPKKPSSHLQLHILDIIGSNRAPLYLKREFGVHRARLHR